MTKVITAKVSVSVPDEMSVQDLNGRIHPLPGWPDDKHAIEVCEASNVRLVEAQEEEIKGMWDWLDDQGNACEMSFPTEGDAARNAIKTLDLQF